MTANVAYMYQVSEVCLPWYSWVEFVSPNCSWIVCDAWNTIYRATAPLKFASCENQMLKVSTHKYQMDPVCAGTKYHKRFKQSLSDHSMSICGESVIRWTKPGSLVGFFKSQQFKQYFLQHSITYYLNLSKNHIPMALIP